MSWWDLIAPAYDLDLGVLGSRRIRQAAIKELRLQAGNAVLEVACGNGLNFESIERKIGSEGRLIGIDYSTGMLEQARKKVRKHKWGNIHLIREDARRLSAGLLKQHAGIEKVDRVLCALGFSVVPDWKDVFEKSYELLKEGGRYAILDWYPAKRTWFLELIAKRFGELGRNFLLATPIWEPLMRAEDFSQRTFFGGLIFVAGGTKPGNVSLSRDRSPSDAPPPRR